ncbi:hypothetical protein BCR44DRAFT_1457024 [Catenaria anguillulae PL171]|uniref:P-loop containing nucleoside triphosphate hydrolase protein n=1 Tax=Catenaria anguillulae PL171 TaxID=765915 RepID=A0A1Y2I3X9_9FUNG|nr:hypothetical protein BCR44DRAFT_1457024 [Catenaria anguillulae PL171]
MECNLINPPSTSSSPLRCTCARLDSPQAEPHCGFSLLPTSDPDQPLLGSAGTASQTIGDESDHVQVKFADAPPQPVKWALALKSLLIVANLVLVFLPQLEAVAALAGGLFAVPVTPVQIVHASVWAATLAFSLATNNQRSHGYTVPIFVLAAFSVLVEPAMDLRWSAVATPIFLAAITAIAEYELERKHREEYLASRFVDAGYVPSLEPQASIFSQWVTYSWCNPLLRRGVKKHLTDEDVWELVHDDSARATWTQFNTYRHQTSKFGLSIVRTILPLLVTQVICGILSAFFSFSGPFFLNRIVSFIENKSPDTPHIQGYVLVLGMFLFTNINNLFESRAAFCGTRSGFRVRSILITEVYLKVLTRKATAGAGKITNLFGSDSSKVHVWFCWAHGLFVTPLQLVIAIGSLYFVLGWSAFVGIAFLVCLAPIQSYLTKQGYRRQKLVMEASDARMSRINEMLLSIRMIKFNAWGSKFAQKVTDTREKELNCMRSYFLVQAFANAVYTSGLIVVSLITFLSYTKLQGAELDATTCFTAISLFRALNNPVDELAFRITNFFETRVSYKRITQFLDDQVDMDHYQWHPLPDQVLREMDRRIPPQVTVDPATGALPTRQMRSALLRNASPAPAYGTFHGTDNEVHAEESLVGFRNATLSWDIEVADLAADDKKPTASPSSASDEDVPVDAPEPFRLKGLNVVFPPGKLSLIVGLTASGKSSILHGLLGEMKLEDGQIMMPTEGVALVSQQAWLMNATIRNNITFNLPYDEQRYLRTIHACALARDLEQLAGGDQTEVGERGILLSGGQKQRINLARACYSDAKVVLFGDRTTVLRQLNGCEEAKLFDAVSDEYDDEGFGSDASITAKSGTAANTVEAKRNGKVGMGVYKLYLSSTGGWPFWSFYILGIVASYLCRIAADNWLRIWARQYAEVNQLNEKPDDELGMLNAMVLMVAQLYQAVTVDVNYYLSVYAVLGLVAVLVTLGQSYFKFVGSMTASRTLHARLLKSVLDAPVAFYDSTPAGRIINRFSQDMGSVDTSLMNNFGGLVNFIIGMIAELVLVGAVVPLFFAMIPFLLYIYWSIASYYLETTREVKRVQSTHQSPMYSHFQETINGATVIRAFRSETRFTRHMWRTVDNVNRGLFTQIALNRWMSQRTGFTDSLVLLSTGIAILVSLDSLDGGLAGLCLSYALVFSSSVVWLVRTWSMLEINANSLERVGEYLNLPKEEDASLHTASNLEDAANQIVTSTVGGEAEIPDTVRVAQTVPADWPQFGRVEFRNVTCRYRADLPPVLKNISFTVEPGARVAICGRTGAGKSSTVLALFRFIACETGQILIDGVDISQLMLDDVRSRMSILPQDPVCFEGTIRSNLDIFNEIDDSILNNALNRVQCGNPVTLDTPVSENASNLSIGQRQLLMIARALLRGSKIMVLDEATASVDAQSDAKIQTTLRESPEFKNSSMICIAHRIKTIIDFDKVIVLDHGEVVQMGTPFELLQDETGPFYSMCIETGEFDQLARIAEEAEDARRNPSDPLLLPPIATNRPASIVSTTGKESSSSQGASSPKLSGGGSSRRGSFSNNNGGMGTPLGSARQSHHSVAPPVRVNAAPPGPPSTYSLGQGGPSAEFASRVAISSSISRSRQGSANPNHALGLGTTPIGGGGGGGGGLRPLAPLVNATSHDSHLNPAVTLIPGPNQTSGSGGGGSTAIASSHQYTTAPTANGSSTGAFMTAPAVVMASAEKLAVPRKPSSRLRTPSPVLRPVSHDTLSSNTDRPMSTASRESSAAAQPSRPPSSTGVGGGSGARGYLKASPLQSIMSPADTPTKGTSVNTSRSVVQAPPQSDAAASMGGGKAAPMDKEESNQGCVEDGTHVVLTQEIVVAKNVLRVDQKGQSPADLEQQLKSISHVRLDRLNLVDVGFLATLPHITNLYLQHNNLTTTSGLSSLPSLRFLTLAHNRLTTIADLAALTRLVLLDLSHNHLPSPLATHIPHLPRSLVFLDLSANTCTANLTAAELMPLLSSHLPMLDELNGQVIPHADTDADADAEQHDRPDDDEDFLAYLAYAGTADHDGKSSLVAGSVSTLIESVRGGADPVALAVASRVVAQSATAAAAAGNGGGRVGQAGGSLVDPGVLKVAAFNVSEVREAVAGTLRRAGKRGEVGGGASGEYSRRVEEVKARYGFSGGGGRSGEAPGSKVDGVVVEEEAETQAGPS